MEGEGDETNVDETQTDVIGDENVGSMMLSKMGWQKGKVCCYSYYNFCFVTPLY